MQTASFLKRAIRVQSASRRISDSASKYLLEFKGAHHLMRYFLVSCPDLPILGCQEGQGTRLLTRPLEPTTTLHISINHESVGIEAFAYLVPLTFVSVGQLFWYDQRIYFFSIYLAMTLHLEMHF